MCCGPGLSRMPTPVWGLGGAGGRKEGLCSLPTTSLFPALLLLLNWGREASLFRKSFLDNCLEGGHPLGTPTPRKGA